MSRPLSLASLSDTYTADALMIYIHAFRIEFLEIFCHFSLKNFAQQLAAANLLYQMVQRILATKVI